MHLWTGWERRVFERLRKSSNGREQDEARGKEAVECPV
jgi:hypothetical protein